ncbi:MAG: trimethylamine methyltransferase family protein [Candidatus Thermoplasmatota archaeon]
MAVLRTKFLERDEEDLIHEQSLKGLADIGVMIHSPSVLEMLQEAGADVDRRKEIARIPEGVVDEAIRKAPRRIRYHARDPKHDFEIPTESFPFAATNGLAMHIADLETGKDHPSTREDLATFSRLADALDQVDYLWTSITPSDVPKAAHGVHELWVTLQNTVKHVEEVTIQDAVDARMQIALGALVAGGLEELRMRPIFSVIACPIAPLTFEKGAVEAQVEFAKAGVPVLSMSVSLGGMTSPVTLAGTLTNINMENLASLVIDQVAAPGSPHVYSSDSTPVNMQTGYVDYTAVETPLISAGAAQMARRYGLPCMTSGWGSSVTVPGLEAPFSELAGIALSVMSGTDLTAGMGGTDVAKGCSYEQLVIDAYMWENLRAFMRDFTISEETIALEVTRSVGHGNTFLRHAHTTRNFRKELFFRDPKKLRWEATLSDRMVPEAREIAKRLLEEHEVPPLDRDVRRQGNALIREYESRLVAS